LSKDFYRIVYLQKKWHYYSISPLWSKLNSLLRRQLFYRQKVSPKAFEGNLQKNSSQFQAIHKTLSNITSGNQVTLALKTQKIKRTHSNSFNSAVLSYLTYFPPAIHLQNTERKLNYGFLRCSCNTKVWYWKTHSKNDPKLISFN